MTDPGAQRAWRWIATVFLVFSGALMVVTGISAGIPVASYLGFIPVLLWAAVPLIVVHHLLSRRDTSAAQRRVVFAGGIIIGGAGACIHGISIIGRVDAQVGLVFMFLPAYQLAACAILYAVSLMMKRPQNNTPEGIRQPADGLPKPSA